MKPLKYHICLNLFILFVVLGGCKKQDITSFEADAAVNFTESQAQYSFMVNPDPEYIQEIPVRIIGNAAGRDRNFAVTVVQGASTTAAPDQYQIVGGVVKANEFTGNLSVKLKNSVALNTKSVSLKLKLTDGGDFKAGNGETSEFVLTWTNQILVPNPWSYFQYFFTTKPSTAAYRIILQTTGLTKFTLAEYRVVGTAGAEALGTKFGDYVKQWNKDHPDNHLKHDDGVLAGQDIVPLYYTHSKFD